MSTVRRATDADLDALVAMGGALHAESPRYRAMPYDEGKVRALFHHLKGSMLAEVGAVFVAERAGHITGMAVGMIAERWFNAERYATDLTVYVRPEERGGTAFPRLVRALEQWAAGEGVADLALGVSTEIHAAATARMYERMGYRLAGYTMVKRHGN